MKERFGKIYLEYFKAKVKFVHFYKNANIIVKLAILGVSLILFFNIVVAPVANFIFQLPGLKKERLEAIAQKEERKRNEEMIKDNRVGDGDIVIDFNDCYEYEISGVSPRIKIEVEMRDSVNGNDIEKYPIDVKVLRKTESEEQNEMIDSEFSNRTWKNGDVAIFIIDVDDMDSDDFADCNYTFENIYKEVKIENIPTYYDESHPLGDELIDKWHNYLDGHLKKGEVELEYIGFYEAASSGLDDDYETKNYNVIQALYLLREKSGLNSYYYVSLRNVALEDVPGSENHVYANPDVSSLFPQDLESFENVTDRNTEDYILRGENLLKEEYTYVKFNRWDGSGK